MCNSLSGETPQDALGSSGLIHLFGRIEELLGPLPECPFSPDSKKTCPTYTRDAHPAAGQGPQPGRKDQPGSNYQYYGAGTYPQVSFLQ